MLNSNVADTTTLQLSSNTLSVLKVPNALTGGTGITSTGTFDGSTARTFSVTYGASAGNAAEGNNTITFSGTDGIDIDSGSPITIGSGGTVTLGLSAIPNSSLANSTISGVSLGSNLNSLSVSTTLSGTSYNGSATVSNWAVVKVPNALTAGTNLNSTGTFDGSSARTINLDANISVTSITASNAQITNLTIDTIVSASDLDVAGTITAPNIGTGTDNSVVVLNASGLLKTDEIDSRVWGSTLVDGSGTTGYPAYWSDSNTLTKEQYLSVTRGGTGLGTIGTNYILTGNGTSAMIAESGLTFDATTTALTLTGNFSGSGGGYFLGKVGIGTVTPISALENYINDATTGISTYFGDGLKPGILSHNISTTVGSFASYDFRANNADARIAYVYRGTNDGDMQFVTDGAAPAMTILNNGNVGIGTTSPGALLHLYGNGESLRLAEDSADGNPHLSFYQQTTRRAYIQSLDSDDSVIIASEFGPTKIYTGTAGTATEKMRIGSDGNVGIGTATPIDDLHIEASNVGGITISGSNPHVKIFDDGGSDPVLIFGTGAVTK